MELYLVRHGQSEGNVLKNFHGQTDYPLTGLGREQARAAGQKLRAVSFTRCLASDLSRAWETAQLCLEGRDIPLEKAPGLREQDLGELEGLTWDGMEARWPGLRDRFIFDWFHFTPPGGESSAHMERRVARVLDEVQARGEDTLLVAHFGSLSLILKILGIAGEDVLMRPAWGFEHGCYTAIHLEDGAAQLTGFNL